MTHPIFQEIFQIHGLLKVPVGEKKIEVPWVDYDPIMRDEEVRRGESQKQNKLHWTGD